MVSTCPHGMPPLGKLVKGAAPFQARPHESLPSYDVKELGDPDTLENSILARIRATSTHIWRFGRVNMVSALQRHLYIWVLSTAAHRLKVSGDFRRGLLIESNSTSSIPAHCL